MAAEAATSEGNGSSHQETEAEVTPSLKETVKEDSSKHLPEAAAMLLEFSALENHYGLEVAEGVISSMATKTHLVAVGEQLPAVAAAEGGETSSKAKPPMSAAEAPA